MSSPARSSAASQQQQQGSADDSSPLHYPADHISAQDRKEEALRVLKSDVLAALQKEVKSLDEDSWKFAGPRSKIHLISRPDIALDSADVKVISTLCCWLGKCTGHVKFILCFLVLTHVINLLLSANGKSYLHLTAMKEARSICNYTNGTDVNYSTNKAHQNCMIQ